MAIHADYPGLTVEIFVDGKPLEEYEPEEKEENEPKTTTRYIECRSGAQFAIKTNFRSPFAPMNISICVRLDGARAGSVFAQKHAMLQELYTQSSTKWKEGGKWRASKFLFSDLSIVEDNSAISSEENPETLGSIGMITVMLIPVLRWKKRAIPRAREQHLREIGAISEEAIKGDSRSHMIRLAPKKTVAPPREWKTWKAEQPLVTFQFKYRSTTALKSLGMIPRSPSPPPIPEPELIKKEESPEPTQNIAPNVVSPAATLRPKTASVTPTLRQPKSGSPSLNEHDGLTDEDIIALIKHYRGNDKGLAGQNRKHLLVLLKHYVDKDNESVRIKQEATPSESRVHIKCEHDDDGAARGQGKRRKPEVIVLDD
ncbi:hypothetical protein BKA58DRAFT_399584 [Alternaria rosae]|uniref:uncharacterized protein n=1 Tax=Alternaria rosae TaxID=1187941 RepID=UPI001E8CEECC|nr:uncharacterized protein BKA58DRAFT_399584 [Alternaria rosae]KAH6875376.1 hypothetical protein BKA58DRAFT_399584 [Alternaria rosae]